MKIDSEDNRASLTRRWGVPLGVATGVAALSVTAVAVFGGTGNAEPVLATPAKGGAIPTTGAAASPTPSTPAKTATPGSASAGTTDGSISGGTGTGGSVSGGSGSAPVASEPVAATITGTATTPIDARSVAKILASCLGSDASRYDAVIAVRTPAAAQDWDGVVVAVDSAGQYVQCESKGDKGNSPDSPPTFINDRLWGAGHLIEYFDSIGAPAGKGRYATLGAGHYTSGIAKITVSYGDDPKQYPATMAGGAFVYAAALSTGTSEPGRYFSGPSAYVHAFDASGKEVYDQAKDPQFAGE
ncbi:hypothetical protein [Streptomyces sp. NBC_00102]|uniref:hypothetical protein n=1 Tax=Streptomyces sp. NBC_00102 TaxID=2975652 RepID=UPI00224F9F0B|nr:hypothetical protein [Streptomyces sp. NBC_00102]MCX5397760.1 hypothetical protein [Streptomyces sp. NBC_00102]